MHPTHLDQRQLEFFRVAQFYQCECGAWCSPASGEWRFNGSAWEHAHGQHLGHIEADKMERRPAAHDTGDGWYLHEIDNEGNVVGDENGMEWPSDWPESVNAVFLRGKGFLIIPQDLVL